MGRLLDKIPGRVGCGQRLASRAKCSRFGDISIRFRGGNAAVGKGSQKENKHNDRVGILQDGRGGTNWTGIAPSVVDVVEGRRVGVGQRIGHGVGA